MTISAITPATGTLTSSGTAVADAATIAIGGKTYTFKDVLTNTDGFVAKGASAITQLANLGKALGLTGVAGTDYAALTVINPEVRKRSVTNTVLTVEARASGTTGNLVPIGAAPTNLTRSGALLTGGTGQVDTAIAQIKASNQLNSQTLQDLDVLDGPTVV